MQLERVTSRSGQAALAGWISSNDVTLFTTVLVMAIAMFLHARLTEGAKENAQINQDRATLVKRLDATAVELGVSNGRLEKTRDALHLTQDERDQLRHQFIEKLDDIARLNTKLDMLLHEKSQLASQYQVLIVAKESLSREKTELLAQQVSLVGARDSLKSKNANLRERLDAISNQLAERIAALEQVEVERDRLNKQADELEVVVAGLKQQLDRLTNDLSETRNDAAIAHARAQTRVRELETQLGVRDETIDDYLAKLKHSTAVIQGLTIEKTQLKREISESELQHQAELLEEGRNNRELIGLTGQLERVAILFDASGSMQLATAGGSDRWDQAQNIAAKWLQHLNVQRCVLIVYSSTIRTFPKDGSLADLRGESGKSNRELLLQQLTAVTPGGWTNTYDALHKAYEYDVDSILLFSDGAPTASDSGDFDPATAKKIYDLCRAHPEIPIHTVGLGNYFQQNTSTFLMSLAKISSGTFRGQ